MKLLAKNIEKDGSGYVSVIPEHGDDMWHIYNIILIGDFVEATTFRKVQQQSSTGENSGSSFRVRTNLTIKVESTDFDSQAGVLRLKGKNVAENEYVKIGGYHTLDIEFHRKLTITKIEWDSIALTRIDDECDVQKTADLGAIVMHQGLANVCLVTKSMTIVRAKIEKHVEKKRKGHNEGHEKSLNKFYHEVMEAMLRHFDFNVLKCVLIASPGFYNESFFELIIQEATRKDNKVLLDNRHKIILVHCSSGFKTALKEVLSDEKIQARLTDTKAYAEIRALERFHQVMKVCEAKTYYGYKHVLRANEAQAIETLLVSETLFRNPDVSVRRQYINLVDSAKENGAEVIIFSSLHVSGEQLDNMTGVAAILRYPMPEIEENDTEESDDDSSDDENRPGDIDDRECDSHNVSSVTKLNGWSELDDS